MPELPDVEAYRVMVQREFKGTAVVGVTVHDKASLQGLSDASLKRCLHRHSLLSAERHGKFLFLRFGEQLTLLMHFGPAGALIRMATTGEESRYSRLRLDFSNRFSLCYENRRRIGRVSLIDTPASFIGAARLGPDAIDPDFGECDFSRLLLQTKRPIKSLLTDQSKLSGVGNTWSDEILFRARIHPATASASLTAPQSRRLFRSMREVLKIAISKDPSVDGFRDRLPRMFLLPHRRPGGHCPRCGHELRQIRLGGHTSTFCPNCQNAY